MNKTPRVGAEDNRAAADKKPESSVANEGMISVFQSAGRHHFGLFGIPKEQLTMALAGLWLFGVPFVAFFSMLPFWDFVGNLPPVKMLNSIIAPSINALSYDYRAPSLSSFPMKRFLVASSTMVEIVVLSNFFALFRYKVRKHVLRVWMCFERKALLRYLVKFGAMFFALWFVFFTIPDLLIGIAVRLRPNGPLLEVRGIGPLLGKGFSYAFYAVAAFPVVALLFGRVAAIAAFGGSRAAWLKVRKVRSASNRGP